MIGSWLFALISIFLTGACQTLLKMGARKEEKKNQFIGAYLNLYVIIAYGLFVVVTILSVYALRDIPLKVFYSLTSLNLFIVMTFSYFILREPVNKGQIIGVVLIIFGIIVFNI